MTMPHSPATAQAPAVDLARLLQVARHQRGIMNCILASLAVGLINAFFLPDALVAIVNPILTIAVGIACIYFTLRLANAVFGAAGAVICALIIGAATAWVAITGAPYGRLLILVVMAVVNGRATTALRQAGFKVGLMGGNPRDVEARMQGGAAA